MADEGIIHTIVVDGEKSDVLVYASTEPVGEFYFPCNFFITPRIVAKAVEVTLTARRRGLSLKNPSLEFLRRLLLEKQVRNLLNILEAAEQGCYIIAEVCEGSAVKKACSAQKTQIKMPLPRNEAISYYKSKLCLNGEDYDPGLLEEHIMAYQALSLEDRWPKCRAAPLNKQSTVGK